MEYEGVDLSFDKISLVGITHDDLDVWVNELNLTTRPGRMTGTDEFLVCGDASGLSVQYKGRISPLGGRVVPIPIDAGQEDWNVRLEWNPNKAGEIGAKALAGLGPLRRITRLDLAMDYPGVRLSDYTFTRPRVKTMTVCGWRGLDETVYLGRWGSRRFTRCYDKGLEMGLDEDIMRIETVSRLRPGDELLPESLLGGLSGTIKRVPHEVSIRDAGLLALYHYEPERLQGAHKRTRSRALDLARRYSGDLAPAISAVYGSSRRELAQLARDIRNGVIVPVAKVYAEVSE